MTFFSRLIVFGAIMGQNILLEFGVEYFWVRNRFQLVVRKKLLKRLEIL